MPIEAYVVAIVVLAVVFIRSGIVVISQGMEYTLESFGRYTRTMEPGLHFIMPFVERIGAKINMMEQVMDIPSQQIITKDNAMVTADGVVFYQVLDASKAAYEVSNLRIAILNLVMTNLRTVMGSMDLDELLSQRNKINAELMHVVDEATKPWGLKLTRIEIRDIQPPRDLVDSMARQMKAERERRAQILEAEGYKQAAILKAEGQKQAEVLSAEARKQAAFLDAEARERSGEAEAKATQMVSDAIAKGHVGALNYFVAQKYVEAFKSMASSPNQKMIFMPMEMSGLISSIGGVAELAKDALQQGKDTAVAASGPWTNKPQ
ncbi:MAG: SPFH/Band 7/PHB domain protein [Alphaproteobacteria bacterium]|nr:SPFH/Band 7/PHB domain protein [Alphaproteobacteria bacterium]